MSIMDMTVEETNLIAIYKANTIPATLARIGADGQPQYNALCLK